ncbi:MAG TPA: hypothetical protein VN774_02480 [Candidatus Limnocylindrales bacterium]|nr:hypothetical protein [Candidatus Limnocylindrales bacterium]
MATYAQQSRIQFRWDNIPWVVYMIFEGPMAGLACHARMSSVFLEIEDVGVTGLTDFMPGVADRPGRYFL